MGVAIGDRAASTDAERSAEVGNDETGVGDTKANVGTGRGVKVGNGEASAVGMGVAEAVILAAKSIGGRMTTEGEFVGSEVGVAETVG